MGVCFGDLLETVVHLGHRGLQPAIRDRLKQLVECVRRQIGASPRWAVNLRAEQALAARNL